MIYEAYGRDLIKMTVDLMTLANIKQELHPSMIVCIKPHLSLPQHASYGATTHLQIVEGIIDYLQQHGISRIIIAESGWLGTNTRYAFQATGLYSLAQEKAVQLVAVDEDETITHTYEHRSFEVSKAVTECDYLINVPVLKPHSQFVLSGALRNYTGLMSRETQLGYYIQGPQRTIARAAQIVKPQLHIMDNICGDLKSELGHTPIYQDRLLLCHNGLLLDSYASELIGYAPFEVPYLVGAKKLSGGAFFDPETNEIIRLNSSKFELPQPSASKEIKNIDRYIVDRKACSCCKSAIIYALYRLKAENKLDPTPLHRHPKLYVGRDYKGRILNHLGIGDCCNKFSSCIAGCPPTAYYIYKKLLEEGSFINK